MTRQILAALDPRQRYTVAEAREYLRISRPYLYGKLKRGEIQSIKDGTRRFIPGSEIARLSALAE